VDSPCIAVKTISNSFPLRKVKSGTGKGGLPIPEKVGD